MRLSASPKKNNSTRKSFPPEKPRRKRRGESPKALFSKLPEPGPKNKGQVDLTDSDFRIIPSQAGGFEQAHNGQAVVDIDSMLIVKNHVAQQSNDKLEVTPAAQNISRLPDRLGTVETLSADADYFSTENVEECEVNDIFPYIAVERQQNNVPPKEAFTEPEPLTALADPVT